MDRLGERHPAGRRERRRRARLVLRFVACVVACRSPASTTRSSARPAATTAPVCSHHLAARGRGWRRGQGARTLRSDAVRRSRSAPARGGRSRGVTRSASGDPPCMPQSRRRSRAPAAPRRRSVTHGAGSRVRRRDRGSENRRAGDTPGPATRTAAGSAGGGALAAAETAPCAGRGSTGVPSPSAAAGGALGSCGSASNSTSSALNVGCTIRMDSPPAMAGAVVSGAQACCSTSGQTASSTT